MKFLVIIFIIFLGFLGFHLLTATSENADKELSRILTETNSSELKASLERVVIHEDKVQAPEKDLPTEPPATEIDRDEGLFGKFSEAMEQDEIEGLNVARSYFFNPELPDEAKVKLFEEILLSDISEENKKYLSREVLKGPSDPSPLLFEKALRNYTAALSPEDKLEVLNDLRDIYRRDDIKIIIERFALDQGL